MNVEMKLETFRKFYILPHLASKMTIFTVYTLYIDDNLYTVFRSQFLDIKSNLLHFWSRTVHNGAQIKIQKKLETVWKFHILPIFASKPIIFIHSTPMTIFGNKIELTALLVFDGLH